jgi:hypothetical protein
MDWFSKKEISEVHSETTTAMLNFMQRGARKN